MRSIYNKLSEFQLCKGVINTSFTNDTNTKFWVLRLATISGVYIKITVSV